MWYDDNDIKIRIPIEEKEYKTAWWFRLTRQKIKLTSGGCEMKAQPMEEGASGVAFISMSYIKYYNIYSISIFI